VLANPFEIQAGRLLSPIVCNWACLKQKNRVSPKLELATYVELTKINHNRNIGMSLTHIKHAVADIQASLSDNPTAVWILAIAGVLAFLVFGGLLLNAYFDWRHERQKAQAVERLHKHLQSLPSQKS